MKPRLIRLAPADICGRIAVTLISVFFRDDLKNQMFRFGTG